MNGNAKPAVTRITELQQEVALLANLRPADGAIVSCYLDLAQQRSTLQRFVRRQLDARRAGVSRAQRESLAACTDMIEVLLESELPPRSRGLAVFLATDDKAPVLSSLPFAVPFRNRLTVSRSPDLLPLVQLRELYGRFMFILAQPEGLQLAEVNLGDVSVRAWATTGTGTTSNCAGDHDRAQTPEAARLFSQISLIERHLTKGGACPLFLAGAAGVMQAIPDLLGPSSVARLAGALPMPAGATLHATAGACLRALMDFEAAQARGTAARVLRGIRNQGHALAGTVAVLDAMRNGMAERLVISSDFDPEPGRGLDSEDPDAVNMRVELIRLAVQQRAPVEFADSEALRYLGGVGCLLRDWSQSLAQPLPAGCGPLDLVA